VRRHRLREPAPALARGSADRQAQAVDSSA
jgi:hypothetical protein